VNECPDEYDRLAARLREKSRDVKPFHDLLDDCDLMEARRESGSPAMALHMSKGTIVGHAAGRGRHVRQLVLDD
jgi:hypothetical protein